MKTFINIEEIEFEHTSHGAGLKKVLIQSSETPTMLTQLAYGKLMPGDKILEHCHQSMEEIFYIIAGEGIYTVNGSDLKISPFTVVRIPAGILHSLTAMGSLALEFLYFGIATE